VNVEPVLTGALLLLGTGFLGANLLLLADWVRFRRRKHGALLTWPGPKPPYYGTGLAISVVLGAIVFYKIMFSGQPVFGEGMMFLYYGYLRPLTRQIGRGFYEDGIWADSGFIKYNEVGGISWREGKETVSLIVISRLRSLARRLAVPPQYYGAARRLLRDKIGEHEIHFSGTGLDLGEQDERDQA
jgi:hypothetical protein